MAKNKPVVVIPVPPGLIAPALAARLADRARVAKTAAAYAVALRAIADAVAQPAEAPAVPPVERLKVARPAAAPGAADNILKHLVAHGADTNLGLAVRLDLPTRSVGAALANLTRQGRVTRRADGYYEVTAAGRTAAAD